MFHFVGGYGSLDLGRVIGTYKAFKGGGAEKGPDEVRIRGTWGTWGCSRQGNIRPGQLCHGKIRLLRMP